MPDFDDLILGLASIALIVAIVLFVLAATSTGDYHLAWYALGAAALLGVIGLALKGALDWLTDLLPF